MPNKCAASKGGIASLCHVGRQKGSHRQFFHAAFPERRVTVSGNTNLDIPKGTLNSIFKQAGWK